MASNGILWAASEKLKVFFNPLWNLNDISVKRQEREKKACGHVGEIQIPLGVQSLEIHTPHNVRAFLRTIYNA